MTHDTIPETTQTSVIQPGITRPRAAWRRYTGSLILAVAIAILGCGDGEPTLTGTWTGTITSNFAGVGSLLLTITQTDSQLTGTWQSTFPAENNGGALSGTVGDDTIALTLTAARPQDCSFTVAATRDDDDDDHFSGTYAAANCARAENGGLDVRRQ